MRDDKLADLPLHSVRLDPERCVGCTTCLKKCPTGAIRVRKGRAKIDDGLCIDCGECIRVCPHGAKKAVSDPLSLIEPFPWRIALPAPALVAQFADKHSLERILGALHGLGFDEVYEVAEAAEIITEATRGLLSKEDRPRPRISSACPAVVRLIQLRFPSLIPHLVPLLPPLEAAARRAKDASGKPGAGAFFLSPCAAKVTTLRAPIGYGCSAVDGVIGLKDIYLPLRNLLSQGGFQNRPSRASSFGMQWARSEGESEALGEGRSIAVDGIAEVIGVLEALDNGSLEGVSYIEALACPGGCLGGPLTIENPHVARARLRKRAASEGRAAQSAAQPASTFESALCDGAWLSWTEPVQARSAPALDANLLKAMIMMEEMDQLAAKLPGLDCGSCGAPSCRALAEDVIRGRAVETDCIFRLREEVRELAGRLLALEELKPPGLDKD